MPTKINNLSGLSYDDDDQFNSSSLEEVVLFNGFPVNTNVFPSSSEYIWTFFTASSVSQGGNQNLLYDLEQEKAIGVEWNPKGWYAPSNWEYLTGQLGLSISTVATLSNDQRLWQTQTRLGLGPSTDYNPALEAALGHLDKIEEVLGSEFTGTIFDNVEEPGNVSQTHDAYDTIGNTTHWVNGEDAVFSTKFTTESEEKIIWRGTAGYDGVVGYTMGSGYNRRMTSGFTAGVGFHYGTQTLGTGPRSGAHPDRSPFIHLSASIPPNGTNPTFPAGEEYFEMEHDRFLHYAFPTPGGNGKYQVVRTPQRLFNYHPDDGVSRKFVGFYYHGFSIGASSWDNIASNQIYNGVKYIATVWATQYNRTSRRFGTTYTHPTTGDVYENYLQHHTTALIPDETHFVELQPGPTFLGGITLEDVGNYISPTGASHTAGYSEFPSSGSDWKSKVLEIPDSAFDYEGTIRLNHNGGAFSDVVYGDLNKNKGIYIYVAMSGTTSIYTNLGLCNFQIGEYDNALVPQSILDQLE